MKTAPTWSVLAGVVGTVLALPGLRADPTGGATLVPAAYWSTGDEYGSALDRRLPDNQAYAPPQRTDTAPTPHPFRTPATAVTPAAPVFAAHPLGGDDFAAPAIPQLPPFNVTDSRLREVQPPELYTRQGMIYSSFLSHPGLRFGNFFHTNDVKAYEMYQEQHWNDTKTDYWQTAFAMAVGGDVAEGRLIKQEVYDEDLRMRAEAQAGDNVPENGQLQFGAQNGDSKVLEVIPVFPISFPLVRVKW